MKRISIAGLCLMAVFAFTAIMAGSASATEIKPEYGQCLAKKDAVYTTGTCTVKDAKKNKGKYEWYPGRPATCVAVKKGEYTNAECTTKSAKKDKGKFEKAPGSKFTSSTGPGELETPALSGPVECTESEGKGEILNTEKASSRTLFKHCSTGGKECKNVAAGEIETEPLETYLIGHEGANPPGFGSKKPVPGEVWTQFSGVGGASIYSSNFECAGTGKVRTYGWVDAKTSPLDVMGTSNTFEFSETIGEFKVLLTEAETGSGWSPPGGAKSVEKLTGKNLTEAKIETRIEE